MDVDDGADGSDGTKDKVMAIILFLGLCCLDYTLVMFQERAKTKRMDMVKWMSAFLNYALAADAAEACNMYTLHLWSSSLLTCVGLELRGCDGTSPHMFADCRCV